MSRVSPLVRGPVTIVVAMAAGLLAFWFVGDPNDWPWVVTLGVVPVIAACATSLPRPSLEAVGFGVVAAALDLGAVLLLALFYFGTS